MNKRDFARQKLIGKLVRTRSGVIGIATNVDFVEVMHPTHRPGRLVIQIQQRHDPEPPTLSQGGWYLDNPIDIWGEGSFDLHQEWARRLQEAGRP